MKTCRFLLVLGVMVQSLYATPKMAAPPAAAGQAAKDGPSGVAQNTAGGQSLAAAVAGVVAGAALPRRDSCASTVTALRAIDAGATPDGSCVFVAGYHVPGDGGGGWFVYARTSAASDNGGTVIAPAAGTGRWLRFYRDAVTVKQFGAVGDGVADDTPALQAAIDSKAALVVVDQGKFRITRPLDLRSGARTFAGLSRDGSAIIQSTDDAAVLQVGGAGLKVASLTLRFANPQPLANTKANAVEIYALFQSTFDNLLIYRANRGFYLPQQAASNGANWLFSCTISNVTVGYYSNRAFELRAYHGGISGNVLQNIYCLGRDDRDVALDTNEAIYLASWSDGLLQQINVESTNPTEAIYVGSCDNLVMQAVHFEGLRPRTNFGGLIHIDGGNVTLSDCSVAYSTIGLPDSYAAIRLGTPNTHVSINGVTERDNTVTARAWKLFALPNDETGCMAEAVNCSTKGFTSTGESRSVPSRILRYNDTYASINLNGFLILSGEGNPEGVVTTKQPALYLRRDGGAAAGLYFKPGSAGNTGWILK